MPGYEAVANFVSLVPAVLENGLIFVDENSFLIRKIQSAKIEFFYGF
jgi:hypothetical protein